MDATTFEELDSCYFSCVTCKGEFEFSDMNDPDDGKAPAFCPMCGLPNAAPPADVDVAPSTTNGPQPG